MCCGEEGGQQFWGVEGAQSGRAGSGGSSRGKEGRGGPFSHAGPLGAGVPPRAGGRAGIGLGDYITAFPPGPPPSAGLTRWDGRCPQWPEPAPTGGDDTWLPPASWSTGE